jgi:flavin reductase (DIM6/NTAB) family NADH-FMN oxidoreductase RutF
LFKEISVKDIKENFIKNIADEWMLVSAGNKNGFNMMTASWGFVGEMWGEDCAITAVRPQRYTMEFIAKSDKFTLSFYGDKKEIHKVCGSKSGRDTDKVRETGLTPVFEDGTVYFAEARLVLVCKKMYTDTLKKENFSEDVSKWYPENDYHNMIIGKIEKAYIKE